MYLWTLFSIDAMLEMPQSPQHFLSHQRARYPEQLLAS
jgi:hypothetical protein